jgi:hypothetical protein
MGIYVLIVLLHTEFSPFRCRTPQGDSYALFLAIGGSMGFFAIFITINIAILYLSYVALLFLFKYIVKRAAFYLEQIGVLYYLGDVLYATGIGISGNGFYDYITQETFQTTAILTGVSAIISGAILRKKEIK